MEIGGVALRDIIVVASGLAGVYFVIMMLRLAQIGRHKTVALDAPSLTPPPVEAGADGGDEAAAEAEAEADSAEVFVYPRPQAAVANEAPSFGAELTRSHLEREIKQLREEVAALRAELDEIKAARRVSPQYADAMALVQRGLTAQDVADRCSISLAEAELVWALGRGPQNFDQEDDYGGEPGRTHARSA
ncbi:MAG: hypothetical protein A2045_02345 [Rhodocyclales bacterium GWA2_65_20]|nr:MAG: hypothetical protein A2045_02345 [Rhodocyclales bacterium GWA2_65_20]